MKRDARVLEQHTNLISRLEQTVRKQADIIKALDVAINQQGLGPNDFVRRSCEEIRAFNPHLPSGMYWIDPDGQETGDAPIAAHCDMNNGPLTGTNYSQSSQSIKYLYCGSRNDGDPAR